VVTWLPIETAPKDGSWILAADEDWQAVVRWADAGDPCENGGWWCIDYTDEIGFTRPTHWKPLDALPKPGEAQVTTRCNAAYLAELQARLARVVRAVRTGREFREAEARYFSSDTQAHSDACNAAERAYDAALAALQPGDLDEPGDEHG
jgi:hypothetical protein